MLLDTGQIGETDIKELDVSVLDELENLGGIFEHALFAPNLMDLALLRVCSDDLNVRVWRCSAVSQLFHSCYKLNDRKLWHMTSPSGPGNKDNNIPLSSYPGERLGLPESGPQSVARVGRRLLAITLDWVISALVLMLVTGKDYLTLSSSAAGQLQLLGVFVVLQILGIWFIGGSMGHRIFRLYLVNISGGALDWWRPIVRSVLLALVVPALVWDSDQRGFHDKIAGTILLKSS